MYARLVKPRRKGELVQLVNSVPGIVGVALNLITVQPEADQPWAETGADLKSDTN
jgi:hypothetical protein